jgi:phosphopantothenoylcysteine decarboxylase/phosphopantothenate--cysteine ligase
MHQAVMARVGGCDIFIATAAVADYRPGTRAAQKIKKDGQHLELALERTPDILAAVAALATRPFAVGFAAETENLAENAQAKLARKSLDMIAANWVGRLGSGFESDDNALQLFWQGGGQELPLAPKDRLARQLISITAERYHAKNTT